MVLGTLIERLDVRPAVFSILYTKETNSLVLILSCQTILLTRELLHFKQRDLKVAKGSIYPINLASIFSYKGLKNIFYNFCCQLQNFLLCYGCDSFYAAEATNCKKNYVQKPLKKKIYNKTFISSQNDFYGVLTLLFLSIKPNNF